MRWEESVDVNGRRWRYYYLYTPGASLKKMRRKLGYWQRFAIFHSRGCRRVK